MTQQHMPAVQTVETIGDSTYTISVWPLVSGGFVPDATTGDGWSLYLGDSDDAVQTAWQTPQFALA